MRILTFAMLVCLVTALPVIAQPNNEEEKEFDPALVRAGNELVENMPSMVDRMNSGILTSRLV